MDNSRFYYGTQTAGGINSGLFDCDSAKNTYAICAGSSELKEKIFLNISAELQEKNIYNEMIFSYGGCFGIVCPDDEILIADGDLLCENEREKAIININLDKFFAEKYPRELLHICRSEMMKKADRCRRFLSAAESIKSDLVRIDGRSIDMNEIVAYSSKLWKKVGGKMKGSVGMETKRFVSCITPEGVELNMSVFDGCERLAVIVDKTGAVSTLIVDRIRRYALGSGYDVVSCVCSLDGKTVEHIIIPELKFGIFSSEHYHRILPKKERRVFAARFHTKDSELYKNRLNFSLKAYRSLMNEAFDALAAAEEEKRKSDYFFSEIFDFYGVVDEIMKSIEKSDL